MSHTLHAAFAGPSEAAAALLALERAGFARHEVEVRSSVPLPRLPGAPVASRVPWLTVAGGVVGGLGAWLLATLTALAYPLPTGGMPIVALPPVAIVTYEGAALGAILATVAAVLLEAGLGRRRCGLAAPGPLDGEVAAGRVVVVVGLAGARDEPDAVRALAGALRLERC